MTVPQHPYSQSQPTHDTCQTGNVDIARITCGANRTVVLLCHTERDVDGAMVQRMSLWGAGDGQRGQLRVGWEAPRAEAHGDEAPVDPSPWMTFCALALALDAVLSSNSEGWMYKDVAMTWETTYIVLTCPGQSDILLTMGSNDFGLLGRGRGTSPGTPRVLGPRHVVAEVVMCTDASVRDENIPIGWDTSWHGQLGPEHRAQMCVSVVTWSVKVIGHTHCPWKLGSKTSKALDQHGADNDNAGDNLNGKVETQTDWEEQ
ncbi:hypothetical protein V8E55_011860 [Tylopilus felleus]